MAIRIDSVYYCIVYSIYNIFVTAVLPLWRVPALDRADRWRGRRRRQRVGRRGRRQRQAGRLASAPPCTQPHCAVRTPSPPSPRWPSAATGQCPRCRPCAMPAPGSVQGTVTVRAAPGAPPRQSSVTTMPRSCGVCRPGAAALAAPPAELRPHFYPRTHVSTPPSLQRVPPGCRCRVSSRRSITSAGRCPSTR